MYFCTFAFIWFYITGRKKNRTEPTCWKLWHHRPRWEQNYPAFPVILLYFSLVARQPKHVRNFIMAPEHWLKGRICWILQPRGPISSFFLAALQPLSHVVYEWKCFWAEVEKFLNDLIKVTRLIFLALNFGRSDDVIVGPEADAFLQTTVEERSFSNSLLNGDSQVYSKLHAQIWSQTQRALRVNPAGSGTPEDTEWTHWMMKWPQVSQWETERSSFLTSVIICWHQLRRVCLCVCFKPPAARRDDDTARFTGVATTLCRRELLCEAAWVCVGGRSIKPPSVLCELILPWWEQGRHAVAPMAVFYE